MSRRRRALEHLNDDIRDHIDRETQDYIDQGMTPVEARTAALRKFGNVGVVLEDTRAVWRPVWLEQFFQDVRFAIRMSRRNLSFTLVVVLTLALGIGLSTAVFSVVNAVLIRPLPYPHAERLVWLTNSVVKADFVTGTDFLDWKAHSKSFDEMMAYDCFQEMLTIAGAAEPHWFAEVTDGFWKLSDARPALGELFTPSERDALVISYSVFERRFGRDPRVIGRAVKLSGRMLTITGVLPPDFRFVFPQTWPGLQTGGSNSGDIEGYLLNPIARGTEPRGGPGTFQLVAARLKPGVSLESARAELEGVQARMARENPRENPAGDLPKVRVMPLQEKVVGGAKRALLLLLGAVGFVLLIACANVANLLLARATSRRKEVAIRAAIGAGWFRVARQLAGENLVLTLLGGAAGLLLARLIVAALVQFVPLAVPRLGEANLDLRVLLFALCIAFAASAVFGLGLALSLRRSGVLNYLKQGARTSASPTAGGSIRRLVVAAEMALAIVLLTGAGLLIRSFWRMNAHPPGFEPEHTLSMQMTLTGSRYRALAQQRLYFQELLSRIQDVPGVWRAGVISQMALAPVQREGQTLRLSPEIPMASYSIVSADFGRVLGMRLVSGRWLTDHEKGSAVMINESFARVAFGNSDPIGRRILVHVLAPETGGSPATVVGVVSDLKYTRLDAGPPPEAYLSYLQANFLVRATMMVRTSGDAYRIAPAIRRMIAEIDGTQQPDQMTTLEQLLADSVAPRRFNLFLLGTFASSALLLALIGIYGVVAYDVVQRTQEIGIRAALGAQKDEIERMVVRQGATILLAGMAMGLAAAFGLTRLMAGLLFEVTPTDPTTFGAVTLILFATALVATWIPARKAARVDPLVALRLE